MRGQIRLLLRQLAGGNRRHERIRVDLSVRMMKRHPDLDTAVLERVHVLDIGACAELDVAVRPDLENQPQLVERQGPQ